MMENSAQQSIPAWVPKVLGSVAALPFLAFTAFGFMASFEGNDPKFIAFRAVYAVVFCCISGFLGVVWRGK